MGTDMILCTVCARGGSVGVKNKNLIDLCGKPLLAHTLLQAKSCGIFSAISVSSDSAIILAEAEKWGADFCIARPQALASESAAKLPAIQHAVSETEKYFQSAYDILIDLDVTSPLRTVEDIKKSYQLLLEDPNASNVVTGCPARHSPWFNMLEKNDQGYAKLVRESEKKYVCRQEVPPCYDMNASIYVWRRETFFSDISVLSEKTRLYVMPYERSVDIDSEFDLMIVRQLASTRKDLRWNEYV